MESLISFEWFSDIDIWFVMGNSQPKPASNVENEEVPKISHEKFANRQIIKNGPEEESIMIKLAVPHQKEYTSWSEQVDKMGQQ